jgi:hypothetical protein
MAVMTALQIPTMFVPSVVRMSAIGLSFVEQLQIEQTLLLADEQLSDRVVHFPFGFSVVGIRVPALTWWRLSTWLKKKDRQ